MFWFKKKSDNFLKKMGKFDLCNNIKGLRSGSICTVEKGHALFGLCTSIGGNLKSDKCFISDDRLKELIIKK